jgi:hypothetical protein
MSAADGPHHPEIAVERRDAPPRLIALLAAGLLAFCVVAALALALIYPSSLSGLSDAPHLVIEPPRLQIDPQADLTRHQADERAALTSYGWVERRRGLVRIPIDKAMQDVMATGIKDWPKADK